jgi:hypothetical protein
MISDLSVRRTLGEIRFKAKERLKAFEDGPATTFVACAMPEDSE